MMYAKCNIHRLMILLLSSITCSLCSVLPYVDKNHHQISDHYPDEPLILDNSPFNGFPSVSSPDSPDSSDSPLSSSIKSHHQTDLTSIRPNDDNNHYSFSTDFLDILNRDEKLTQTEPEASSETFENVIKNPHNEQDRGNKFISDGNRKKTDEEREDEEGEDNDRISSSMSKDDVFDPELESHSPSSLASSSQPSLSNVHSQQELPMPPPDYTDEWPSSFDHHPRNLHFPHNVNIFPSQPSPPPPLMSSSSTPSQPISTSSRLLSHLIPSSSPSMINLDEPKIPVSVLKPSSSSPSPPSINIDNNSSGLRSLEIPGIITVSSSTPVPEVKSIDYAASLIKDLLKSTWSLFKDQNTEPKEGVDTGAGGSGTKFEDFKSEEGEKNHMVDPLATDGGIENGEEELLGEVEKLILTIRQYEAMEAKKLAEAEKDETEDEIKDGKIEENDGDEKKSENKDDNVDSNHHKSRNNRNRLTHQMDYVEQLLNEYRSKQGVINLRHWARGVSTPRLSVTSPIAVLRDALMEEIRRKRLKEQQERIKENKKMLDEIG
ncbi:uncharacterized protein LOC141849528 [Brevipalpus obovatus]|uniref:uncharacterized protein LOC141849528 n=1 Tax=Brevipalpus obovatus TaxID=246614 RepID=UPI003D9E67A3